MVCENITLLTFALCVHLYPIFLFYKLVVEAWGFSRGFGFRRPAGLSRRIAGGARPGCL